MYYEDYAYDYPTEDMKTEFHIKLDDIIDEEVEKRLEERIEDIAYLREKQKQYDEKIAEAKAKQLNEENKQKALQYFKDIKEKLDKENHPC